MAGTRVLSQVISASSCERNWSAHWHIPLKIRNRLEPATTEKLACVYSNSKMLAATHDAVELKKLACDNEDANIAAVWLRVTLRHTPLRAGHGPDVARVAESTPSRESRVAAPRLSATQPTWSPQPRQSRCADVASGQRHQEGSGARWPLRDGVAECRGDRIVAGRGRSAHDPRRGGPSSGNLAKGMSRLAADRTSTECDTSATPCQHR